ncbi:MAG: RnfABCDGE type electron transport complex subunit G [Bacteroidota bacterium]
MASRESTFTNMVLTLFIVTLVASSTLGLIYKVTKNPIEQGKLEKKTQAIKNVVPDFTNQPLEEAHKTEIDGMEITLYPAKKEGKLVGVAASTITTKGFSGEIKLMVGFKSDGTINNIAVLEHKETPGLGDKMEKSKSDWSLQFNGKDPEDFELYVQKDGGDVDAITASTISSRAYCDAVRRAYEAFKKRNE